MAAAAASTVMTVVFNIPLQPNVGAAQIYFGEWLITFGLTTLFAALPWFAAQSTANRLGQSVPLFLVASATLTAVGADLFAAYWAHSSLADGDPEQISYAEAFWRFLPTLIAGGLTGGLLYALAAERHKM